MGYQGLVRRSVRKAMKQIKDLGMDVVFQSNKAAGFDFNKLTATVASQQTLTLKALRLKTAKSSKSDEDQSSSQNAVEAKLLMLAEDVPDLNAYDAVTFGGAAWRVVHPIENDGFTVTVNVTKEA